MKVDNKYRRKALLSTAFGGTLVVLLPHPAAAADPPAPAEGAASATEVGEVLVTANRRVQDVTTIPYNVSSVDDKQIENTRITKIEDLARQVPNLSITSASDRFIGAQRPIIRGLNASSASRAGFAIEQAPVATYLGNVPTGGFFPIADIERVEVLRGPQGTLYGAGSLGGTIRVIPKAPTLGSLEGWFSASGGLVAHSSQQDYTLAGSVSIPLGDTVAVRINAKHDRAAGFVDAKDLFVRENEPYSPPVLANPRDVANSPGVLYSDKDYNWGRTDSGRIAVRWDPTDALNFTAAFDISDVRGQGGPVDNPTYNGGRDPFDPRVTHPDTGKYEIVLRTREPYKRLSKLGSLDASYDFGFATLSSTTSYFKTRGTTYSESSYITAGLPASYLDYYIGNPVNPRYSAVNDFSDTNNVFTQEVRFISNGNNRFDYVVGAFFQRDHRTDTWNYYLPGLREQAVASRGQQVTTDPSGRSYLLRGAQTFKDKAIFGEITWNVTDRLHITGGARFFDQSFQRDALFTLYSFGISAPASNGTGTKDHVFKLNASYEYADHHQVYATFSQGFRRGGANAFATVGPTLEPASILIYTPDTVDNYELGVKGRFSNGIRYTVDVFLDNWNQPQLGLFTPFNYWPVVVNGSKAKAKGFEIEVSGPITRELSYSLGYAYSDAYLTKAFCVPVGTGGGSTIPCGIGGNSGQQLPGAPKSSATGNVNYEHLLANEDKITASLNVNYKGSILQTLPAANLKSARLSSYWLANASVGYEHGPWQASLYVQNLANKRALLGSNQRTIPRVGDLVETATIVRPRSVGVSIRYNY